MRLSSPPTPVRERGRYRGRIAIAIVGLAVLAMTLLGAGSASASGGPVCVPVRLTGEGVATSPTTTTATIFLNGRPIATTDGTFVNGPAGTFSGTVIFTPKRIRGGTLVADVTGAYGSGFTSFTAAGPVRGTGVLSRASGQLSFSGTIRADGSFSETVTGTLCADLRGW